ncbi:hypothetical protein Cfor_10337, partial [Coptotermes formosanus]
IQALVSLNEQISTSLGLSDGDKRTDCQHPSPPQLHDGGSVASRQQQAFDSSMALMRRLLVDAQVITFCKYVLIFEKDFTQNCQVLEPKILEYDDIDLKLPKFERNLTPPS